MSSDYNLSEIVNSAIDEVLAEQEKSTPQKETSLDAELNRSFEKYDGAEDDREIFARSRDIRDAFHEELGQSDGKGADIGALINDFLNIDDDFKKNPQDAADRLASRYLLMSPYDRKAAVDKAKAANPSSNNPIDQELEKTFAQKEADARDKTDYESTEKARARLKASYPGLTFDEALRRARAAHEDLRADPLGAAARIAASYGAPITETQHQAVQVNQAHTQRLGQLEGLIAHAERTLPNFAQLAGEIETVITDPRFKHGDDPSANLARAYQVAMIRATQSLNADRVAKAQAATSPKSTGSAPQMAASSNSLDAIISNSLSAWSR
jgi:hypothetical protein